MVNNSKIKRIISALLCAFILAGVLSSCSGKEQTGVNVMRSVLARNTMTTASQNADVHFSKSEESFGEAVASSGLIELLIDEATA